MQDEDGKSKGFGFINFETADAAAEAVEKNNGTLLEGKELWCGKAQKKADREAELKQKWDPPPFSPFPLEAVPKTYMIIDCSQAFQACHASSIRIEAVADYQTYCAGVICAYKEDL